MSEYCSSCALSWKHLLSLVEFNTLDHYNEVALDKSHVFSNKVFFPVISLIDFYFSSVLIISPEVFSMPLILL